MEDFAKPPCNPTNCPPAIQDNAAQEIMEVVGTYSTQLNLLNQISCNPADGTVKWDSAVEGSSNSINQDQTATLDKSLESPQQYRVHGCAKNSSDESDATHDAQITDVAVFRTASRKASNEAGSTAVAQVALSQGPKAATQMASEGGQVTLENGQIAAKRSAKEAMKAKKKAIRQQKRESSRAACLAIESAAIELEKLAPRELTSKMEEACAAFATKWQSAKDWDVGAAGQLNIAMQALAKTQMLTDEERTRRVDVINRVADLISKSFPMQKGLRIVPYGSFVSGICNHFNNLDLSLEGTWEDGVGSPPKQLSAVQQKTQRLIFREIVDALKGSRISKGRVKVVLRSRVPVLKFVDRCSGISCNLCLSNTAAIEKSEVLQWLGEIDGRFLQLMTLVKLWAKAHKINASQSGTFNGFTLAMMVIFHLQSLKLPVLPPLCEIFGGATNDCADHLLASKPHTESHRIFAYEARSVASQYRDGRYGCCQLASVLELFASFIVHMKAAIEWWLQGGSSFVRLSTWAGGWTANGWQKPYAVAVEDPFDASENCARSIGTRGRDCGRTQDFILKVMTASAEALSKINTETCLGDLLCELFGKKSLVLLPPELCNGLKTGGPKICIWPKIRQLTGGLKSGNKSGDQKQRGRAFAGSPEGRPSCSFKMKDSNPEKEPQLASREKLLSNQDIAMLDRGSVDSATPCMTVTRPGRKKKRNSKATAEAMPRRRRIKTNIRRNEHAGAVHGPEALSQHSPGTQPGLSGTTMGMDDIDMYLLWELYRGGGPNIPDVMTGLAVSLQNPTAVPEPRSSKGGRDGLIHKNAAGKDLPRSELTTRLEQSSLQGEDPREGTKQTILSHQGGSRGSRGWRGWRENRGGGISDSGIFPMPMPGGMHMH